MRPSGQPGGALHRRALAFLRLRVLAIALALTGAALAETDDAAIAKDRPLVFASDEWCPYVCFESTREGYLVDLARALFESPSRPVEIRRMSWARALAEAEAGRIDGVLGATPGESARLVYPERPAAGDPVAFALRRDDDWSYTGIAALSGRRIGVAEGYRFGPPFDAMLFPSGRAAPGVERVSTENPTHTNLQKLVDRRIESVLDNGHVLRHEIDRGGFMHAVRVLDTGVEHPLYLAFPDNPMGRALADHFDDQLGAATGRRAVSGLTREYGRMDAAP
jgi:polar amino acid transport system substrate-binding protein